MTTIDTTSTTAATAAAATGTPSKGQSIGLGLDKDTFLKLLVAQVRYQDPSSPMDSNQYMAQMAQFAQVEQLTTLVKAQAEASAWQRTVAGAGMVGKQVTAEPVIAGGTPITGVVTGIRISDVGPRLVLADGTTVSVDDVTEVSDVKAQATGS